MQNNKVREVRILTPTMKIIIPTIVIIAAMIIFRVEIGFFLIAGGVIACVGGVLWLGGKVTHFQRERAITQKEQARAWWERNIYVVSSDTVAIREGDRVDVRYLKRPPAPPPEPEPMMIDVTPTQKLLDLALDFPHVFLLGGTGTGKTTVMNHLFDLYHKNDEKVFFLSPHSTREVMISPHCEVVGAYRNFHAIEQKLASVVVEMEERFKRLDQWFEPIVVGIDEWPAIVQNCPSASDNLVVLLCEARKVNIRVLFSGQGQTVKTLGLQGRKDILDNVVFIRFSKKDRGRAILHYGLDKEEEIVELPGVYIPSTYGRFFNRTQTYTLPEPVKLEPTEEEALVLTMLEGGASYNEIATKVWGSRGGNQNKKIKAIEDKFRGV